MKHPRTTAATLQARESTYEFSEGTRKQIIQAIKKMKHYLALFEKNVVQEQHPVMHHVISKSVMDDVLLGIDIEGINSSAIRQGLRGPGYHATHAHEAINKAAFFVIDDAGKDINPRIAGTAGGKTHG